MIWLLSVVIILFVLILYILFAPLYIEIDTGKQVYRLRFHRMFSIDIIWRGPIPEAEITILGRKHKTDNLAGKREKKNRPERKKKRRTKLSPEKIIQMIKSFHIKTFSLDIDTGDQAWNAILFPAVFPYREHVRINFHNYNRLVFIARNNFYRIIKSLIIKS